MRRPLRGNGGGTTMENEVRKPANFIEEFIEQAELYDMPAPTKKDALPCLILSAIFSIDISFILILNE